jgi:hypothetical protein
MFEIYQDIEEVKFLLMNIRSMLFRLTLCLLIEGFTSVNVVNNKNKNIKLKKVIH